MRNEAFASKKTNISKTKLPRVGAQQLTKECLISVKRYEILLF